MSIPPPVPRLAACGPEVLILLLTASAALTAGLLAFASVHGVLLSPCVWKAFTGLPCAGCGGTRAVVLLASGRWLDAVQMNPGVALLLVVGFAAALYAAAVLALGLRPLRPRWLAARKWRWLVVGSLLANWLYLLAAGRA